MTLVSLVGLIQFKIFIFATNVRSILQTSFFSTPQQRFRVTGLKRRKPDPIAQKSAAVPSEAEDYR
jgi:hypothetical protein